MTRGQRMQRIVSLADLARRNVTRQVVSSRKLRDDNQEKLTQFRRYHREYADLLAAGSGSLSAARVREIRRFLAQVEKTIAILERQSASSDLAYRENLAQWNKESRRIRVLGEILERDRLQCERVEETGLQREIDDRGSSGGRGPG